MVYNEGDIDNHMYFINLGTILVKNKNESGITRESGDFLAKAQYFIPRKCD